MKRASRLRIVIYASKLFAMFAREFRFSLRRANYVGPVNKVCRDYTAVSCYCYNAAYLTTNSNLTAVRRLLFAYGRSQNIIDKHGPRRQPPCLARYRPPPSPILPAASSGGATASEKLKLSVLKSLRPRRKQRETHLARSGNYEQFEERFLDYIP